MTGSRMPCHAIVMAVVGVLIGTLGCDTSQRQPVDDSPTALPQTDSPHPTPETQRPATLAQASKPDLARLAYDPAHRKLSLYDLPDRSARWMILVPTAMAAVPVVDREYEFPAMMSFDPTQVMVFYTVPNRRPSPSVTLQDILTATSSRAQR